MKFAVSRTSSWNSDDSPCAGTVRETVTRVVRFPLDVGPWYAAHGRNHRREGDELIRDHDEDVWVIEFADLDALLRWVADNGGSVVLGTYGGGPPTLEIYCDYRE